jgi:hypothetical protein
MLVTHCQTFDFPKLYMYGCFAKKGCLTRCVLTVLAIAITPKKHRFYQQGVRAGTLILSIS